MAPVCCGSAVGLATTAAAAAAAALSASGTSSWVAGEGKFLKRLKRHGTCLGRTRIRRSRIFKVSAIGDEPAPPEMSLESALKLLGVREGASFDEILQAKKALIDKSGGDKDRVLEVEAAYDALLMQRLTKRRAGEVTDTSVLYADVRRSGTSASRTRSGVGSLGWLRGTIKNLPVSLVTPTPNALATQTAVYGALVAWTYISGYRGTEVAGDQAADATGVTLAIGFGASIYFLRQQNMNLGKAALITTAGLVAGAMIGNVVESWLRVDVVPVAGISSSAVFISEFVLLWLWLVSLYLR